MRLRADIMGPSREHAAPVLIDAIVIKITEAGIVIVGTEIVPRNASSKANVEYYPQTWWCRLLPGKMEMLPERPEEMPKWRMAFQQQ